MIRKAAVVALVLASIAIPSFAHGGCDYGPTVYRYTSFGNAVPHRHATRDNVYRWGWDAGTLTVERCSAFYESLGIELPNERKRQYALLGIGIGFIEFPAGWRVATQLSVRWWIVSAVLLLYPAFVLLRGFPRRSYLRRHRRCVECGYNLTGNVSGVCPECGTVIEKPESKP